MQQARQVRQAQEQRFQEQQRVQQEQQEQQQRRQWQATPLSTRLGTPLSTPLASSSASPLGSPLVSARAPATPEPLRVCALRFLPGAGTDFEEGDASVGASDASALRVRAELADPDRRANLYICTDGAENLEFWSQLLEDVALRSGDFLLTPRAVEEAFVLSDGIRPDGIPRVLEEMGANGAVVPEDDWLRERGLLRSVWAALFSPVRTAVAANGRLVVRAAAAAWAERLAAEAAAAAAQAADRASAIVLNSDIAACCPAAALGPRHVDAMLAYLYQTRRATPCVVEVDGHAVAATKWGAARATDAELQAFRLALFLRRLRAERERLERSVAVCTATAQHLCREKRRAEALVLLRKRRRLEGVLLHRAQTIDSLEQVVETIDAARTDHEVFEGLQLGLATIREENARTSPEAVEDVLAQLAEAVDERREIDDAMGALDTVSLEDDPAAEELLGELASLEEAIRCEDAAAATPSAAFAASAASAGVPAAVASPPPSQAARPAVQLPPAAEEPPPAAEAQLPPPAAVLPLSPPVAGAGRSLEHERERERERGALLAS